VPSLEFSSSVDIRCPPEKAFDYFADYRHVAAVLKGINRWEPIGARTQGVGARYTVELQAIGVPLRSLLRINRWRRPHEIGWISESGLIKQEGGFTFTPRPSGVRIVLRIAYTPPGWAVGAAVGKRLDWVVRQRLEQAMKEIKDALEK
jgi:uncharacterized membrane protein